jgi:hypothetical protein
MTLLYKKNLVLVDCMLSLSDAHGMNNVLSDEDGLRFHK